MEHLFRGESIDHHELEASIKRLGSVLEADMALEILDSKMVIEAIGTLMDTLDDHTLISEMVRSGLPSWQAHDLMDSVRDKMTREALRLKCERELPNPINTWIEVEGDIKEKYMPLGVLLHIGAGNVIALSVISVIEGLLAGNINILKLPSYEGGLSLWMLKQLVQIEPRLKPYIYVFDIPSEDTDTLMKLGQVADGAVVWGSDAAITGIRQMAPPTLRLVEWGHRISFAYVVPDSSVALEMGLKGLAEEICLNNQQYCSSPQCVFLETEDDLVLKSVGKQLLEQLCIAAKKYPQRALEMGELGEITWTKEVVRMESITGEQMLFESMDDNVSVLIDVKPILKSSPKNRNIWLMPIQRNQIPSVLRKHIGHLQTVGLICGDQHQKSLAEMFYKSGVNRVTTCDQMSRTYVGEPHDGRPTLFEYVRRVSYRL